MPFALSCKHEYALSALVELAAAYTSGQPIQSRQLAGRQHIPDRYLEQLLACLKRGGLVRSQRGVNGGYLLAREPMTISVLEVIHCIDGRDHSSSEHSLPPTVECSVVHEVWNEAQQSMEQVLNHYSLKDLVEKRDNRQQTNRMYYI
ncbi:MAG: Rrf2 family transcriptional regulator [Merismopedia sp. SIO2A8]|nr:Rrf2 family transcriptional regulator [Symploca sp. SIO2B6]NET49032.1 Rrf2 family transcriptional regulator [Merismopedia sp. SIO2A8]